MGAPKITTVNLRFILNALGVGKATALPVRVYGGLLHIMWRIDTEKGTYAVKQLSRNIILTEAVKTHYELTEKIAQRFINAGIPAVCALEIGGKHLIQTDDAAFLVYPWVNAKSAHEISYEGYQPFSCVNVR